MNKYTVRYERDEDGWWVASVIGVPGCHTQGKTIAQTRDRIREALGLFVRDANRAQLLDDIRLPARASELLDSVRQLRRQLELDHQALQKSTQAAAASLTKECRLSLRDAGELLDLSYQRVQQIAAKDDSKKSKAAGKGPASEPAGRAKSANSKKPKRIAQR